MRNTEFAEWLYGYYALGGAKQLTPKQLWIIKNHLNLVFAVEQQLDADNQWLDDQIVALANDNIIGNPTPELLDAIYARYGKAE